jgi:phage terminase large subunit GpA-like protein
MVTRNVILVAITLEVRCPHCGAAQPAPDGSETVDVSTAKELCSGDRALCVACDEPIRLAWHDKVGTQ